MTKNSENSISLSWKEVKKADGYYVYNLDNDANKYVKLGESKGNENCKFEIKNIPSASVYKIKVLAYRSFMNKACTQRLFRRKGRFVDGVGRPR